MLIIKIKINFFKKYFNIFMNKNQFDGYIPWQVTKRKCPDDVIIVADLLCWWLFGHGIQAACLVQTPNCM